MVRLWHHLAPAKQRWSSVVPPSDTLGSWSLAALRASSGACRQVMGRMIPPPLTLQTA